MRLPLSFSTHHGKEAQLQQRFDNKNRYPRYRTYIDTKHTHTREATKYEKKIHVHIPFFPLYSGPKHSLLAFLCPVRFESILWALINLVYSEMNWYVLIRFLLFQTHESLLVCSSITYRQSREDILNI